MITQDDIDEFADQAQPDIEAAIEYARRAKKGLPSDRWANGVTGAKAVARGIIAMTQINSMLTDAVANLWAEKVESSVDAMRLHSGDSKYHK